MTRYINTFEAGTNGAAITSGNSGGGSGQAIRTATSGTSTQIYSTAAAIRGAMGARLANSAGAQSALRSHAGYSSTNAACSFDFVAALPASGSSIIAYCANATPDVVASFYVQSDGSIRGRMRNAATNTAALQSTAGGALVNGTAYRMDILVIPGTGTGDGTIAYRFCLQGSNTPVTGMNISSTVMDAGTTAITDWYVGAPQNHTLAGSIDVDDFQYDDNASGAFIGAFAGPGNNPPTTVTPAPQLIQAGSGVTLTQVPADTDGTIASASWAAGSWPATASTPTFASGAATASAVTNALTVPGVYLFTPDAVDNLGSHVLSPTQAIVGVYAADGSADVRGIRSNTGGWAGTVADLLAAGNTNYIESPSAPVNSPIILDMNPIKPGDVTIDEFTAELFPSGGAASTCKIEILNGPSATVIASRTVNMTGSFVNTPIALTSNENAAFTDHIIWGIRLTANQT